MALHVEYEGKEYDLDLEDMDTDEARAMERFGVKSLQMLEEGIVSGEIDALIVAYWIMLRQNGEPGARLDRMRIKPLKFVKALLAAAAENKKAEEAKKKAEGGEDDEDLGKDERD